MAHPELCRAGGRDASVCRGPARAGGGRERRIALLLLDTIDFPVAFWGAMRAGVVPVPINTLLTHEMVGYVLADSRAEAVVISAPAGRCLAAGAA